MHSEANGDYFKSGDLAYQIKEIIRATAGPFHKEPTHQPFGVLATPKGNPMRSR